MAPTMIAPGTVLSVSMLTDLLRQSVEEALPYVMVRGEITNLARPASGHVYFSLRDGRNLLNCVWFKGSRRRTERFDPLTGEVYAEDDGPGTADALRDGDTVVCSGAVSIYPDRGQYQLRVRTVRQDGEGTLLRRFEELKRRLAAKGWFSQDRKRPIPWNPGDVIVITAATGAAVRDFLRIASQHAVAARIRIIPVPVQGDEAAPAIIDALARANADATAQAVVVIRGGGSMEDLWTFNDERLAEAVLRSRLPVLTGIGHEVDTCLCDLVADLRAATPTHAAQLLWPDKSALRQRVDEREAALRAAMTARMSSLSLRLRQWERVLESRSPGRLLRHADDRLASLVRRLDAGVGRAVERRRLVLRSMTTRLLALDPGAPLHRGYAMVATADGVLVRSVARCAPGQELTIILADGTLSARVAGVPARDAEEENE